MTLAANCWVFYLFAFCLFVLIKLDIINFRHAHLESRTDSRALRAEYCIVGIAHNTAI